VTLSFKKTPAWGQPYFFNFVKIRVFSLIDGSNFMLSRASVSFFTVLLQFTLLHLELVLSFVLFHHVIEPF
jgi:hypothetical protein